MILRLVRVSRAERIQHDHAVGHFPRRAHVVRHHDAGHRMLRAGAQINSLITSLMIGSSPVVGSS